jgi:hypothetical protein
MIESNPKSTYPEVNLIVEEAKANAVTGESIIGEETV